MAAALVGCGGGTKHGTHDGGGGDQGGEVKCSGTLHGAIDATITYCHIGWNTGPDVTVLSNVEHIDVSDESQVGTFGFSCKLPPSAPSEGTFDFGNCKAMLFVIEVGPAADRKGYMAIYDETNPSVTQGSGSITINSFELEVPETGGITIWKVHGAATATMPPPKGATWGGEVSLDLTF